MHTELEVSVPFPSRRRQKERWKLNGVALFVSLIGLMGLGIFMYPPTAAWWSQYHESKAIGLYSEQLKEDPAPGNAVRLAEAYDYNTRLTAGDIVVGAGTNKPIFEGDATDPLDYWNILPTRTGVMARLKIPSIKVDLPVYHGTSDETLEKGVGHLQGTALPVGGVDTRAVLTAHTGLATATLFNDLGKMKIGDVFTIEVFGEVLSYRAVETLTILPDETEAILPRAGADLVTLITCTPLGINTHRYLVTGERVFPTPVADQEAAGRLPDIPGFPWWAVILLAGVSFVAVYLWRSGYPSQTSTEPAEPKLKKA